VTLTKLLARNWFPAASSFAVVAATAKVAPRRSDDVLCDAGPVSAEKGRSEPAAKRAAASVDSSPKTLQHVIYSDLMHRRREVFLTGTIDEKSAQDAIAQMLYLERLEPGKPLTLLINSGGGKVSAGLALHDVMKELNSPVRTVCLGRCMSMAAVLLASGEPGSRCASANSRVMIHEPHVSLQGSKRPKSIAKSHAQIEHSRMTLCRLLSEYTGLPCEKVEALLEEEYYMDAKEAKELGIVDHVGCSLAAPVPKPRSTVTPPPSETIEAAAATVAPGTEAASTVSTSTSAAAPPLTPEPAAPALISAPPTTSAV